MRILSTTADHVATDNGQTLSFNEVCWNYRSECCGCALERLDDRLHCKWCGAENPSVVHKSVVAQELAALRNGIDALPDSIRAQAVDGYYQNLSRGMDDPETRERILAARVVHVVDCGNGEPLMELPEALRRR